MKKSGTTYMTSFRFTEETRARLRRLSARWGVTHTRAVELLVEEAEREGREIKLGKSTNEGGT